MHLTKEEQLLATGRISALFKKFAVPGVVGLLFIGLQPMIDGAVLGNFVGTEALASISIFVPIYTFMNALAVVVGVGCRLLSAWRWEARIMSRRIALSRQPSGRCLCWLFSWDALL